MNTELNVPQAIAFTIYAIDVYIAEAYEKADITGDIAVTEGADGIVEYEKDDPFDFDPMEQGSIMDMLGFFQVADNYSGIDIFELWIHPGVCWIEEQPGTTKINQMRLEDVLKTGAETVVTACPYCLQMFEDSIEHKGLKDSLKARDLVELVEAAMKQP